MVTALLLSTHLGQRWRCLPRLALLALGTVFAGCATAPAETFEQRVHNARQWINYRPVTTVEPLDTTALIQATATIGDNSGFRTGFIGGISYFGKEVFAEAFRQMTTENLRAFFTRSVEKRGTGEELSSGPT